MATRFTQGITAIDHRADDPGGLPWQIFHAAEDLVVVTQCRVEVALLRGVQAPEAQGPQAALVLAISLSSFIAGPDGRIGPVRLLRAVQVPQHAPPVGQGRVHGAEHPGLIQVPEAGGHLPKELDGRLLVALLVPGSALVDHGTGQEIGHARHLALAVEAQQGIVGRIARLVGPVLLVGLGGEIELLCEFLVPGLEGVSFLRCRGRPAPMQGPVGLGPRVKAAQIGRGA